MARTPKSISGLTSAAAARVMLWQSGEEVTVPGNAMGLLTTDSVSAYMLTLLDDANAAAARATLGIDEQRRNRIVNGAMQISQENGDAASAANGYYAADQWRTLMSVSSGTLSTQRVQSVTPNGSKDRHRITVSGTHTPVTAGEYLAFQQSIEGVRIADFSYGLSSAKQTILRFGFTGPAGTYSVGLQNGTSNRSYVALFTISAGQANTDTEQVLVIPGDQTGTWITNTGVGISLWVVIMAGTTYQGAAGWNAANVFATSANTNGMAATGTFELFDVGLYLDDLLTGIPPRWEMPDYAEELQKCFRYYQLTLNHIISGYNGAGQPVYDSKTLMARMRVAPSVTFSGVGYSNASGLTLNSSGIDAIRINYTVTATASSYAVFDIIANARM